MFKKRCVKIGIVLLVLGALVVINTNTFGAINQTYYDKIVEDLNVVEGALDSKVRSSVLLDAISILVYAVGSLMEWILGLMFEGISGSKIFPWADAILFNAVPLLDINVFNPAGTSLVGIMQEFVASSYWTVFSIALAFLGIAIMVTAIKLVVSTIASDKALYKQAIMKWLMGFIMLWGIHFFISFVLYLNEGLVETASNIASEAVEGSSIDLIKLRDTTVTDIDIVRNFIQAMTNNTLSGAEIVGWAMVVIGGIAIAGLAIAGWPVTLGAAITGIVGGVAVVGGGVLYIQNSSLDINQYINIVDTRVEAIRAEIRVRHKDGIKDSKDEAIKYIMKENTISIAARLLKNEDYVNSLQATCKAELLAEERTIYLACKGKT